MVQDDPKLLDESGEAPKPSGVISGLIIGHEIVSLLDEYYPSGQKAPHVF